MHEELMIWFAQAVAHSLWVGGLIGVLAWVAVRGCRMRPARQHAILCGALGVMALSLPVTLVVLAPVLKSAPMASASEPRSREVGASPAMSIGRSEQPLVANGVAPALAHDAEADGGGIAWKGIAPWVVGIYAIGWFVMMVRLALAWGGSRRVQRTARPVDEARWVACFQRVLGRLAVQRAPILRWSEEVATPVLVGLLKPMIVLPVALANRLSVAQAEAVLSHELAHLRRHDEWILVVQRLVETVLFYHPVVWWLSRELSRTREQACDDVVLASGSHPADYAEALVRCSELRSAGTDRPDGAAIQLAATGSRAGILRRRVMRILGQEDPIRTGRAGWWLAAGLASMVAVVTAGLLPEAPEPETGNNPEPAFWELVPVTTPLRAEAGEESGAAGQEAGAAEMVEADGLDGSGTLIAVAADPAGAAATFRVEMLIAEVPENYEVHRRSMTKEALAGVGAAKIIAQPKLMVPAGTKGRIEIGGDAGGGLRPGTLTVELSVKRGGLRRDHDDPERAAEWDPIVGYDLLLSQVRPGAGGAVQTQSVTLGGVERQDEWLPFEIGPLKGGRKLAGAVRFTAQGEAGAEGKGEKEAKRDVFHLLPEGRVRWNGTQYDLAGLKKALPEKGAGAIVRAAKDRPYRELVGLMEVLWPVFGQKIGLAVEKEEPAAAPAPAPAPAPAAEPDRLTEVNAQIAECEVEAQRLEQTLAELAKKYTDRYPNVKNTKESLVMVQEILATLRAEKAELDAKRAAEEHGEAETGTQLLEAERALRQLKAAGLGEKHPQRRRAERQREDLLKKLGEPNDPKVRALRKQVAEAELRDLEVELAELRDDGHGAKHPRVQVTQKRIETVRDLIDRLEHDELQGDPRSEVEPAPEQDESPARAPVEESPDEQSSNRSMAPGAPYATDGSMVKRPYFAIGMQSRLQRGDTTTNDVKGVVRSEVGPVRKVIFLERESFIREEAEGTGRKGEE